MLHLAKTKFDHCPMLVTLEENNIPCARESHFVFQHAWLFDVRFHSDVKDHWDMTANFGTAAIKFEQSISHWKYHIFSNITSRKQSLQRRIANIQRSSSYGRNSFLVLVLNLNFKQNLVKSFFKRRLLGFKGLGTSGLLSMIVILPFSLTSWSLKGVGSKLELYRMPMVSRRQT